VRLRLRNFMSYGEPGETLDFGQFHVACLTGDNGEGKSALLDAMTWALWGMARGLDGRGAGANDLIRSAPGVEEAEVEFEFHVRGSPFRVLRRRHRRRGGSLELWVSEDGEFRPFTATGSRAAQETIDNLLRLQYDTFINSVFLLQGRADEFTRQRPTERKAILAQILELDRYDRLEALARERARAARTAGEALSIELERLSAEAEKEKPARAALAQAEQAFAAAQQAARKRAQAFDELRQKEAALAASIERLAELRSRRADLERQVKSLTQEAQAAAGQVARSRQLTAAEPAIRAGYAELEAARRAEREWAEKQTRLADLTRRRDAARLAVDRARSEIEARLRQSEPRRQELEAVARAAPELAEQVRRTEAALAKIAAAEEERGRLAQALQEQTTRAELAAERARRHIEEALAARERRGLLEGSEAVCPLCEQDLRGARREQILAHLEQEAAGLDLRAAQEKAAAEQAARERKEMETRLHELDKVRAGAREHERRLGQLERRAQEAAKSAEALAALDAGLVADRQELAAEAFAVEAREETRAAEAALAALAYDAAEHRAAARRVSELTHFERDRAELETRKSRLAEDETAAARAAERAAQARTELEAVERGIRELEPVAGKLEQVGRDRAEAEARWQEAREEETRLTAEVAAWRTRLEQAREAVRLLRDRRRERDSAAEETALHAELAAAFGKNGLQALIIENAIPQLEEEANRLLARLTDGRMRVSFETQRPRATGPASDRALLETLDIHLSDELGARRYELYSGGEAFRANFAIRLALSKLLASRAGAPLETLIIDEGFGTQDRAGREKLVESIRAVQDDFAHVLVITHMEDLKEAFPHRIEVTKDESGSHLRQVSV